MAIDTSGEPKEPLGADDILDILNEGDEKKEEKEIEKEEKDEVEEEKIEDEEEDEDKEEKEEEIDELDEIEEELKEPTDEELELVTPTSRRAILKKYPKFFEDFPSVQKSFYREQQYSEIFPNPSDARVAQ